MKTRETQCEKVISECLIEALEEARYHPAVSEYLELFDPMDQGTKFYWIAFRSCATALDEAIDRQEGPGTAKRIGLEAAKTLLMHELEGEAANPATTAK